MIILVLNCGSSSVKYQVIEMLSGGEHRLHAKGLVERIGQETGRFAHAPQDGRPRYETETAIPDHTKGISLIIHALIDEKHGVIESLAELKAVGHRVAHGGEYFQDSARITKDVIAKIEECAPLAPLHNPANLIGIAAISNLLPNIPQVATFDNQLHQTMPPKCYLYALPYEYYERYRVRRYGFHGMSHMYVAAKCCRLTGLDLSHSKIVTCHVGNGASVTALLDGKSFDTSMGFTPTDGLIMGTRCGNVDPGALIHIAEQEDMSLKRLHTMINEQSGLLGISGVSSDMRDVTAAAEAGNERARLAMDMYSLRIKKFVGEYAAAMGGLDMVVFTGGVGENGPWLRRDVCTGLEFMGLEFDEAANEGVRGQDKLLSKPSSRVKVMVATTDEELVIATDTFRLLKRRSE
ncbi:MAG: acetate kinase [Rikenellaceae bacterium]|jgi:acetate kinase|nr:acetate kinase [Rikenellaceae bacterium]